MKVMVFLFGLMAALVFAVGAQAQEQFWIQIEAQPTLRQAEDRARAYTGVFADVAGFQLTSGWYAVAVGPYAPDVVQARLAALTAERLVPGDSFIALPGSFARQFWPTVVAGATVAPVEQSPFADPAAPASQPQASVVAAPVVVDEENPAQARRFEAALSREDRQSLQTALQWFGFYTSAIDGAFGPGTRKSMAAWQEAKGLAPTGILTTLQRQALLAGYAQAQAELGLQTILEPESGIEIALPTALVQFDRFDPPFVHYSAKDGSGVSVVLISQPGDQATLYGLYDILQTLEVVPLEGERSRDDRSFTLIGQSATVASHSYAEVSKGLVKGYMLVWNPADDAERMARVLAAMQSSFKPVGERALDPGLVAMPDATRQGLLSGLDVRRPVKSRSGFFVDSTGMVLTTFEATQGCARITLDRQAEADVALNDSTLGLALLKPRQVLAPAAVAQLQTGPARIGSEIALAGYSYEDTLPAPTLAFGTFEDDKGLNGEVGLARLALDALPGDAGGPVFDSAGNVLGMLLTRATTGSRQLPAGVSFAASAPVLAGKLAEAGIAPADPATAPRVGAMAPEDLTALAARMTVLVSCWN
ncbi:MAG: serine protease [Pseudorhodobacter sp.]|nr:serine protease [Pseudorhodobacter sp.]